MRASPPLDGRRKRRDSPIYMYINMSISIYLHVDRYLDQHIVIDSYLYSLYVYVICSSCTDSELIFRSTGDGSADVRPSIVINMSISICM